MPISKRHFLTMMSGGGGVASPLLTGLVSYWKLDELSGNRVDSHGTNILSPTAAVGFIPGKLGNAADCITNYLIRKSLSVQPSAAGFSFWGWIFPHALNVRNVVLYLGTQAGSTAKHYLYLESAAPRFGVTDSTSGSSLAIGSNLANVDQWYFLGGRYNAATKKSELRVGAGAWTAAGTALTNGPFVANDQIRVGGYNSSTPNCAVDAVGYTNRYLTDAEFDQLYNAGNGLEYPF